MAEKRNYRFGIDLSVDCVLTQEERDLLMAELYKLSDRMSEIIGEQPISGVAFVHSERENG